MPVASMSSLLLSPSAQFIEEAITQTFPAWGDNSHAVLVVPTALQIMPVRRAIHQVSLAYSAQTLLLPRVTTLHNWILDIAPFNDTFAGQQLVRLLTVRAALKHQQWLRQALGIKREGALWSLAQTIQDICEELSATWLPRFCQTQELAELTAESFNDSAEIEAYFAELFEQGLEACYHDLHQRVLGEEAQLLLAFWRLLSSPTEPIAIRWRYLQRLLQQLQGPLIWLSSVPPAPIEALFLQQASQKVDVIQVGYQWHLSPSVGGANIQIGEEKEELNALQQIWPELTKKEATSSTLVTIHESSLWEKLTMTSCPGLEAEAQHAAHTIVKWFNQGLRKVALVAQDRLVARRIRALLARKGIPLRDETGWKLSTTRAAAALMGWFGLLEGTFAHLPDSRALLDWLKSPFVFSGRDNLDREIVYLEKNIRRYQVNGGWRNLYFAATQIAQTDDAALAQSTEQLLRLIQSYTPQWLNKSQSLTQWCTALNRLLDGLGMRPLLLEDAAGLVLLETIEKLAYQAQQIHLHATEEGIPADFSLAEFKALLDMQLEQATLLDVASSNELSVTFLPLNGARMRVFEAVLMVGCDASKLPAPFQEALFFSSSLRGQLGLIDRPQSQHQQLCDLAELILNHPQIRFSWQSQTAQGEEQEAAAWLLRLELCAKIAGKTIRKEYQQPFHFATATPLQMPAPRTSRVPSHLNAHEYNALRRCPYQFFSRVILKLGVLDELEDTLEKSEIGIWLHEILWQYHRQFARSRNLHRGGCNLNSTPEQQHKIDLPMPSIKSLESISEEFFAKKIAEDGHALAYWKRWQILIPSYLEWQKERESEGWQWDAGEITLQCTLAEVAQRFNLPFPVTPSLVLKGRIDRLDRHKDSSSAVLDYKVQTRPQLLQKRKNLDDDIQLPFYMLLQNDITEAAWVVLDGKAASAIALPQAEILPEQLAHHLCEDMNALARGARLPAYGQETTCRFCEARGLCRKAHWS